MFFQSRALWHCSVSLGRNRPYTLDEWTPAAMRRASAVVELTLRGVGEGREKEVERGRIAVNWRRPMTAKEMHALPVKGIAG